MNNSVVFVYGTLRKGFRNEHFLKDFRYLCNDAYSLDNATLKLFYDRPYVDFKHPRYKIQGELYIVDQLTLDKLDVLEVHPFWYRRVVKQFFSNSLQKSIEALCYEISSPPEINFLKELDQGCYKKAMESYKGECALDYEVKDGKVVKIKA